jgi:hypothetical protein
MKKSNTRGRILDSSMRLRFGALFVLVAAIATPVAGLVCAWTCALGDDPGSIGHAKMTCHAVASGATARTIVRADCCHETALVVPAVAPKRSLAPTSAALTAGAVWAPSPSTPSPFLAVESRGSACSGGPPEARHFAILRV